jgi:hypothetical protein
MITIDHYSAVKTCIMIKMAKMDNRVPRQNDTVTVDGRTGSFAVIGIDSNQQDRRTKRHVNPVPCLQHTVGDHLLHWLKP